MQLDCQILHQQIDFESPLEPDVQGFTPGWWGEGGSRPSRVGDSNVEFFSFLHGGVEVARVWVEPDSSINDIYEELDIPDKVVDLTFFEVRRGYRRCGIGRRAAGIVVLNYPGCLLTAFSEEADSFWSGIGWTKHPRRDRSSLFRPLFVFDNRRFSKPEPWDVANYSRTSVNSPDGGA